MIACVVYYALRIMLSESAYCVKQRNPSAWRTTHSRLYMHVSRWL